MKRYLSALKYAKMMIGNSSSGTTEGPAMRIPVINIGDRQKGRHLCSNIIQTGKKYQEIKKSLTAALNMSVDLHDIDYWGDGKTSSRIFTIFEEYLCAKE